MPQTVAVVGNGDFGTLITNAIKATGKFNVFIVGRKDRKNVEGVETKTVPEWDEGGLASALKGADTVVSVLGMFATGEPQLALVRAAKAAGAKGILLSEYGVPVEFDNIIANGKRAPRALAESLGLDWFAIANGLFLDYGFRGASTWDDAAGTVSVVGNPDAKFVATAREDVAVFLAQILLRPSEFKNRETQIHGVITSFSEVVPLASKALGKDYKIVTKTVEEAKAGLAKNPYDFSLVFGQIIADGQLLNPHDETSKFSSTVKTKGLDYWIPLVAGPK